VYTRLHTTCASYYAKQSNTIKIGMCKGHPQESKGRELKGRTIEEKKMASS
jgi:hypothetical protein